MVESPDDELGLRSNWKFLVLDPGVLVMINIGPRILKFVAAFLIAAIIIILYFSFMKVDRRSVGTTCRPSW